MEENRDALDLFSACVTQWKYSAFGQRLGLDYAGVLAVARMLDIQADAPMLRKIQTLEVYELGQGVEGEEHGAAVKACRNANACAMCTKKNCRDRI
jgi:hypothetical protein